MDNDIFCFTPLFHDNIITPEERSIIFVSQKYCLLGRVTIIITNDGAQTDENLS